MGIIRKKHVQIPPNIRRIGFEILTRRRELSTDQPHEPHPVRTVSYLPSIYLTNCFSPIQTLAFNVDATSVANICGPVWYTILDPTLSIASPKKSLLASWTRKLCVTTVIKATSQIMQIPPQPVFTCTIGIIMIKSPSRLTRSLSSY